MLDVAASEFLSIDVVPGLVLVSDRMPGITRQRRGAAFAYIGPDAKPVTAASERARILGLEIPQSYGEVWICPLVNGHIQATARDPLGRKRYRYHPGWRDWQTQAGLARMLPLGEVLGPMRARIDRDLERSSEDRLFALASLAALLDGRAGWSGVGGARRQARSALLRSLRRPAEPGGLPMLRAEGHAVGLEELDRYLAAIAGIGQVSTRSLQAWAASTAAFVAVARAREPGPRALAEAAARALGTRAATAIAYVDPDVLALADLPEQERREMLARARPEGCARLHPVERHYLGFLERACGTR